MKLKRKVCLVIFVVFPFCLFAGNSWTDLVAHPSTWSTQPSDVTEFLGSTLHRTKEDLSNHTQARLLANVSAAGASGAKLAVQYSTDQSTWYYLNEQGDGPSVSLTNAGLQVSGWVTIETAARTDVYLRIVGSNGNGVASPGFGLIELQTK